MTKKKALNWTQRIARAKKDGGFTQADRDRSNSWGQCSVGERLGGCGFPLTDKAYRLGHLFDTAVQYNKIARAWELHRRIRKLPKRDLVRVTLK